MAKASVNFILDRIRLQKSWDKSLFAVKLLTITSDHQI